MNGCVREEGLNFRLRVAEGRCIYLDDWQEVGIHAFLGPTEFIERKLTKPSQVRPAPLEPFFRIINGRILVRI